MTDNTIPPEDDLQKSIEDFVNNLIPYAIQRWLRISPRELSVKITEMSRKYVERKLNERLGSTTTIP